MTAFKKEEWKLGDNTEKHRFPESRVYNIDVTSISTSWKTGTIIVERVQKIVGSVTSYGRGKKLFNYHKLTHSIPK